MNGVKVKKSYILTRNTIFNIVCELIAKLN